jgi:RNA recognition motif-containing protein
LNRKIYVGNLPINYEGFHLEYLFRKYGNVVSARVFNYNGYATLGKYGFVEMSSEAEAYNAVISLNNYNVTGRKIVVSHILPR